MILDGRYVGALATKVIKVGRTSICTYCRYRIVHIVVVRIKGIH